VVGIRIWEPNARWTPELSEYKIIRVHSVADTLTGLIQFEVLRDLSQSEEVEKEPKEDEDPNEMDLNWFTKEMMGDSYNVREEFLTAIDVCKRID